jgi:hypothetical protein
MLRQGLGSGVAGEGGEPEAGPQAARARAVRALAVRARGRLSTAPASACELIRRHLLFSVALGLAVVPRVIVVLGFQPAILFKLDTYDYLWDAAHLTPNLANPGGYSLFLVLLKPFHSLTLIASLQHLLGLVVAVLVYAVLRRWGVSGWLATLATLPVLFSPSEFLLEQLIMADFLALLLLIAALAVLLLRQQPSVWRTVTAGLLMGASTVVRPTALPLIAVMALYLLVRRAGWRRVSAVLAGGALPVAMYMAWFASVDGSFNITNSSGLFLWSRTMSFANCSVIKPPADLEALCPDRQHGTGIPVAAASRRVQPKVYLWNHNAWLWRGTKQTGVVPDTSAFTSDNNARALRFAERAIETQPTAYAAVVGRETLEPFTRSDTFVFPGRSERSSSLGPVDRRYARAAITAYTGSVGSVGPYLGYHFGEQVVEPYAHLIRAYQTMIYLPGPVFGLIILIGLVGILIPRRRLAASGLLLVSAVITVLLPIAEHEYNYRYVLPAVPLACMAAALAFRNRPKDAPAEGGPSVPAGMEPAGLEPPGTEPAGMEPAGLEPPGTEPAGLEPPGTEPAGMEPAGA